MGYVFVVPQVHDAVSSLLARGYAHIPEYDGSHSRHLQELFSQLINTWGVEKLGRFTYSLETRPDGTPEYDDGFLDWASEQVDGKDTKRVFHYRPEIATRIRVDADREANPLFMANVCNFLTCAEAVFCYHRSIARTLLAEVDSRTGSVMHLSDELDRALTHPLVTSRAALRLLDYPPRAEGTRAKIHFDRSAITLHAGDEGGDLFVHHSDGHDEVVSPRPGEILAFWGAKADLVARGCGRRLPPVAYGSCAQTGANRRAVVSFWHLNRVLWDAPRVLY